MDDILVVTKMMIKSGNRSLKVINAKGFIVVQKSQLFCTKIGEMGLPVRFLKTEIDLDYICRVLYYLLLSGHVNRFLCHKIKITGLHHFNV